MQELAPRGGAPGGLAAPRLPSSGNESFRPDVTIRYPASVPVAASYNPTTMGARILVVDDEASIRESLAADHGGHGHDHGSDDPRDVTIPWIAWGQGVTATGEMPGASIRTVDTASTVLWLLGVAEPTDWQGAPVRAAFAAAAE